MNIVYAAEKPTIAKLLGDHMKRSVAPEEIDVSENPDETGSFLISCGPDRFVLSPSGVIAADWRCFADRSGDARAGFAEFRLP